MRQRYHPARDPSMCLFTAIHPRFRPTDLASVGLLPDRYKAPGAIPLPTDLASVGLLPDRQGPRNSAPHRPCVGRLAA